MEVPEVVLRIGETLDGDVGNREGILVLGGTDVIDSPIVCVARLLEAPDFLRIEPGFDGRVRHDTGQHETVGT